jgi:transcriptional regulator with XRE-family HTH domain
MRRRELSVSQQELAKIIGIAIHQIRKYEWGTNRVSASRLQQIASALKVTPTFFFDEAPMPTGRPRVPPRIKEFVCSPQGIALSRAFAKISDRKIRRSIVILVERVAGN